MKSSELKSDMLFHCLYRLHYIGAVTEYGGSGCDGVADIFCLLESGYTHEFEVKVSKSDLNSEIKSIKFHLNPQMHLETDDDIERYRRLNKSYKHKTYLNGESQRWGTIMVPNKFSFVVTPELVDFAKESLIGTPYGLYMCHKNDQPQCIIKAQYLHKNKSDDSLKLKIMRKACTELQSVREKLIGMGLSTDNLTTDTGRL